MSKQKELIYNLVYHSSSHMTAEEIFFEAKKQIPSIAFGTVYRNLGILLMEQKIRKLCFANEPDRYDNLKMEHDHLECVICHRIIDLPKTRVSIDDDYGTIVFYEVLAKGICKECQKK